MTSDMDYVFYVCIVSNSPLLKGSLVLQCKFEMQKIFPLCCHSIFCNCSRGHSKKQAVGHARPKLASQYIIVFPKEMIKRSFMCHVEFTTRSERVIFEKQCNEMDFFQDTIGINSFPMVLPALNHHHFESQTCLLLGG